jgi:Ca2+-binding RTX toxin-like protein
VNGGSGTDTFDVTAQTIGATINGGTGSSTLVATGGGTMTMGSNITNIDTVTLKSATNFTANGLYLTITGSAGSDRIQAGNGTETITGGAGGDTLIAGSGAVTFKDTSAHLTADTIINFAAGDTIDITNLAFGGKNSTVATWSNGVLTVTRGTTIEKINLQGNFTGTFTATSDGAKGTDITYSPVGGGSLEGLVQFSASFNTGGSGLTGGSGTQDTNSHHGLLAPSHG